MLALQRQQEYEEQQTERKLEHQVEQLRIEPVSGLHQSTEYLVAVAPEKNGLQVLENQELSERQQELVNQVLPGRQLMLKRHQVLSGRHLQLKSPEERHQSSSKLNSSDTS